MPDAQLTILGATLGTTDVTELIAEFIDGNQEIHLASAEAVLAVSSEGTAKTFSVIYQYNGELARVAAVLQDVPLDVVYVPGPPQPDAVSSVALQVLGASYGTTDVTSFVAGLVTDNTLVLTAGASTFRSLPVSEAGPSTVVYRYGASRPRVRVCLLGQSMRVMPWPNVALQLPGGVDFATAQGVTVLPSETKDFTVEAWVRTTTGGPILGLSAVAPQGTYDNVSLTLATDGTLSVVLSCDDDGALTGCSASTAPSAACDGQWHHVAAVRSGDALSVLLDGVVVPVTTTSSPVGLLASAVPVVTPNRLWLGGPEASPRGLLPVRLTGQIDEVRLWTVARPPEAIAIGMHHVVASTLPGLAAAWTFDDETLVDSSPAGLVIHSTAPPAFAASLVEIEPANSPFLIAQVVLSQDWIQMPPNDTGAAQGAASGFAEITGYRVVVSARDGDGNPMATTLQIRAADPQAPVALRFFGDSTAYTATGTSVVTRSLSAQGQLSFVIDALSPQGQGVDNPLLCPMITVNAAFMDATERLVIAPDRHVHATLAQLTSAQVLGTSPLPTGQQIALPGLGQRSSVDATVQAIRYLMSTAVEHTLQPERPLVRKRDAPIDVPDPQPYVPMYENLATLVAPYDFASNAAATHYLTQDQQVSRILVAENMPTAHFDLSFSGSTAAAVPGRRQGGTQLDASTSASFTELTVDQRNAIINSLSSVNPADAFAALFVRDLDVTLSEADLLGYARRDLGMSKRSSVGRSFWDSVRTAARIIVSTTTTVVRDTGARVASVVVHVIDAAGAAINATLETVEHAVELVRQLLARLGADVISLISWLRTLFSWSDILDTQSVLQAGMAWCWSQFQASWTAGEDYVDDALSGLETLIEQNADAWVSAAGDESANDRTTIVRIGPPADVQSTYLPLLLASTLGKPAPSGTPALPALTSAADIDLWQQQANATQDLSARMQRSGVTRYLTSPEALMNAPASHLLAGCADATLFAVGLVRDAAEGMFDVLGRQVQATYDACDTRIVIPGLTDFYEKVVCQGRPNAVLSATSLVTLVAAVPCTLVVKAALGSPGPIFSPAELAAVAAPEWPGWAGIAAASGGTPTAGLLADAVSGPPLSRLQIIVRALVFGGYGYSAASAVWGVACVIEDTFKPDPKVPNSKLDQSVHYMKITSQFASILLSLPWYSMPPGTDHSALARKLVKIIWWCGIIALASNDAAPADLDAMIGGLYGAFQLLAYGAIAIAVLATDTPLNAGIDVAIGVAEAYEWLPQWAKLAETWDPDPVTRELLHFIIPGVEAGAYGIVVVATAALTTVKLRSQLGASHAT